MKTSLAEIEDFLRKNKKKYLEFAQALVRENSVHGNETAVAKRIQRELREHGITSKLIGPTNDRKSLIAEFGKGQQVLMLNGHLDTVPFGNIKYWRYPPLSGCIKGGRLYGRGSFDMKCSVAAATYAAIAMKSTGYTRFGRLRLLFNFDEESGAHSGIRDFVARGYRTDACVVCEPMHANELRIGSKGIFRFKLISRGKSGHTGYEDSGGINASTKMAKMLLALEKLRPTYKKHPMFTRPLITPGTVIEGGTGINVYPDSCTALVDCRLSYGQSKKSILQDIKRCLARVQEKDDSIRYRIEELAYVPPVFTDPTTPFVKAAVRGAERVLRKKIINSVMGGVTDGSILAEHGIPIVICGVQGGGAHRENEFALVSSMMEMPRVYAAIFEEFFAPA